MDGRDWGMKRLNLISSTWNKCSVSGLLLHSRTENLMEKDMDINIAQPMDKNAEKDLFWKEPDID